MKKIVECRKTSVDRLRMTNAFNIEVYSFESISLLGLWYMGLTPVYTYFDNINILKLFLDYWSRHKHGHSPY